VSGLKVASYRDLEAERRRAEARDLARITRDLAKIEHLMERLARLDDAPESSVSSVRARLADSSNPMTERERQVVMNALVQEISACEQAIARAGEARERLSLMAQSLMGQTTGETRRLLEAAARDANKANGETFRALQSRVEAVVTASILEASPKASDQDRLSDDARAIAAALMSSASQPRTLAGPVNPRHIQINRLLDMLEHAGDAAAELRERARELFSMATGAGFQLKLDTLCLDAAAHRDAERERREAHEACEAALDMLAPFDDASFREWIKRLEASEGDRPDARRALAREAVEHAYLMASQKDAQKARESMIKGLKALGYEIHIEGDDWRSGERISVSRPDEPNYDVQLAARADGKIQTKVRAFRHDGRAGGATPRDIEVEEQWCSDIRTLHKRMESEGLGAMLERDEAPGALPTVIIERPGRRQGPVQTARLRARKSDE
jgi:hypothetical protein